MDAQWLEYDVGSASQPALWVLEEGIMPGGALQWGSRRFHWGATMCLIAWEWVLPVCWRTACLNWVLLLSSATSILLDTLR